MLKKIWSWIFGSKQRRDIKIMWPIVIAINEEFASYIEACGMTSRLPQKGKPFPAMTPEEKERVDLFAQPKAAELKERAREKGESLDNLAVEAFALVKLACWRRIGEEWKAGGNDVVWDMVPFDVQLLGGLALHRGNISEMATGEGKTLVAILPLYLNALSGKGAHLVTVNDYLAKRDSEWMGPIYEYLGLTVGCIDKSEPHTPERRIAYRSDITYGTNNEFGFDYLRDNMVLEKDHLVQRNLFYAIVDEVDSILIDEARTPLIISGPVDRSTHQYDRLVPFVRELVNKQVFLVNRLAGEAEKLMDGDPESYEAGIKLVQCWKGAPKSKRYMKLRSEPAIQRLQEGVELEFLRDKKMPELEADLFFVVDERGFAVSLTDKGREALSPENPTYWVLPDIVEETSEIEGCTVITETDRVRLEALEMLPNEEVKRRKIKACAALDPSEKMELIRVITCPGLDSETVKAAMQRVHSSIHKRLDIATREIEGAFKLQPAESKAIQESDVWRRRGNLLVKVKTAKSLDESQRRVWLRRLRSPIEALAQFDSPVLDEIEHALEAAQSNSSSGSAPAEIALLPEELLEFGVRGADLPDDVKLEAYRILRHPSCEDDERREMLDKQIARVAKRIEHQIGIVDQLDTVEPPPPPAGEGEEQPAPPPPPEKQIEQKVQECEILTPIEREDMLKIIRRMRDPIETRLEQIQAAKQKVIERLRGIADRFKEVLHGGAEETAPSAARGKNAINLDPIHEEMLVLKILNSKVFEPIEKKNLILAMWEPNLINSERDARILQSLNAAAKRYQDRYHAALASITLEDRDREIYATDAPALLDEELIARKIILTPQITADERQKLLYELWLPGTSEEKRRAKIENVLANICARVKAQSPSEAAILEGLLRITDEDRKRLPSIKEPLPDARLRERKVKLCAAFTPEERLGLLRALHCPGIDDDVRQVRIRHIHEKALERAAGPGADSRDRSNIEQCLEISEPDRIELANLDIQLLEDELRERKISNCAYLSEEESRMILHAIWAPEMPEDQRQAMIQQAKEHAKNRRRQNFDAKAEELHNISQLLVAYMLKEKDVDYVIEENKVIIVDEFTGRKMPGRRWSDGLHQAVEAKEGVVIERETQTLATVTIQNYFRMYEKLAGMTGTAETEAAEFAHTYKMDVIVIPPNRSTQRVDLDDVIYRTTREKYNAVIEEIKRLNQMGLPILVGTVSVEVSETLSRMLKRAGVSHNVLNAKNHTREAEIVREAGRVGQVTIATNMAGRGTDIKLGPNVRDTQTYKDENGKDQEWPGGLQILGTERHEARRIDRQLRGRAGRQGDSGTSRFFVSLEDNLMRLFGSDRLAKVMTKLGMQEGEPIIHPWISKAITRAQKKVEEMNFERRKRTLEYDNIMNKQREAIYGLRRELLTNEEVEETMLSIMAEGISAEFTPKYGNPENQKAGWDIEGWADWMQRTVPYADFTDLSKRGYENFDALLETAMERVTQGYRAKREMLGPEVTNSIARYIALRSLDEDWQDHLLGMDDLREGIHLRSYAQRDPLVEYTHDATELFNQMMSQAQKEVFERFFRVQLAKEPSGGRQRVGKIEYRKDEVETPSSTQAAQAQQAGGGGAAPADHPKYQPVRRQQPKVGENSPCPCGSGKKYKKCCGSPAAIQRQHAIAAAEAKALHGDQPPEDLKD